MEEVMPGSYNIKDAAVSIVRDGSDTLVSVTPRGESAPALQVRASALEGRLAEEVTAKLAEPLFVVMRRPEGISVHVPVDTAVYSDGMVRELRDALNAVLEKQAAGDTPVPAKNGPAR
jgi:hypothetical protein